MKWLRLSSVSERGEILKESAIALGKRILALRSVSGRMHQLGLLERSPEAAQPRPARHQNHSYWPLHRHPSRDAAESHNLTNLA